jgi:micrococcal nuclease
LRLLGIDTPEKYSGYKLKRDALGCGVSQKYMASLGKSATKYAKRLVHAGDIVQVDIRGYGYYGRALAMVYLPDGTCYNERVAADGYACVYKYHGHKSKQLSWEEFNKLNRMMQEAREYKRGLWVRDYKVMERLCE